jgi:RNA polymerase sigma factor (TIGR02999 family)
MSGGSGDAPGPGMIAVVYAQLRGIAARQMADERRAHTLQATALVHEAWLALSDRLEEVRNEPRRFFLAAAEAMRRILIDHARRRGARKRGGDLLRLPLDLVEVADTADVEQVLALDDAIAALASANPRAAEVVRLRFFSGLGELETAEVLGLSERTVRREWAFARAWLYQRLSPEPPPDGGSPGG